MFSQKRYYTGNHKSTSKISSLHVVSKRSDSLMAWTLFILTLSIIALICWIGSYYIFSHPEKAFNYNILFRLHKIDPPVRFELTAVPRGEFFKPGQLLEKFSAMSQDEMNVMNAKLIRDFLRNYHKTKTLVPYICGTYKIIYCEKIPKNSFFQSGVVALLQAIEQPEIIIQQIFTGFENSIPYMENSLQVGQEFKIQKPLDISAILHVDWISETQICFTTIPLLYGVYGLKKTESCFSLEPPVTLKVDANLPIIKLHQMQQILLNNIVINNPMYVSQYELHLLEHPGHLPPSSESLPIKRLTNNQVVLKTEIYPKIDTQSNRVDENNHDDPESTSIASTMLLKSLVHTNPLVTTNRVMRATAANNQIISVLPAIPISNNIQKATVAKKVVAPKVPIEPAVDSNNRSMHANSNASIKNITIINQTVSSANNHYPLHPIEKNVVVNQTVTSSTSDDNWSLYSAGKMPRGRLFKSSDIQENKVYLQKSEPSYLSGSFTVTASGNHRAVLRPYHGAFGNSTNIRIIAEFPHEKIPPSMGSHMSKDHMNPFKIRMIQKDKDGQINVFVQEIVK